MTKTVVHLLRHGEVENPEKILYGRMPNYHLSAAGKEMAEKAARELSTRDITYLVSSPLERAQETAVPLATTTGLDVALDGRLIEPSNAFEGQRFGVGDGALKSPRNWAKLYNPFRPSWGEPYREIADRMLEAVAAARNAAMGHEAVCISHQLAIWTARLKLEGKRLWHDPRKRQCGLASVTSLVYEDDKLVEIDYFEPAGPTSPNATKGA
ncbi:MAG TPA: histidine phosphatase family protein [Mycobacteriales bacterium]|jgi:broad specificity phosphatase PhoE|nr:histidine phosphatase family protein [Mycobacteriales bacterium]